MLPGDPALEQQTLSHLSSEAEPEQIAREIVVAVVIDRPPHAK
jgi:hypothetical protein